MANESFAKVTLLGDARSLVKAAKSGQTAMEKTQSAIGKSARLISRSLGTLGIGLSFAALSATMSKATTAAIEDAKSQALLAKQMQNTVRGTKEQTAAVEESITKMSLMAAVPDDEIRPAFATLLRSTKSVGKATKLTSLALDVAAGTGRDVATVSKALGKAYNGNTTSLSKLGINVKKGSNWQKELNKQFKGMAEIQARQDPAKRLQEKLGQGMIPVLNDLADWFNENYDKIAKFFTDVWSTIDLDAVREVFIKLRDDLAEVATGLDIFAKSNAGKALGWLIDKTAQAALQLTSTILKSIADSLKFIGEFSNGTSNLQQSFLPGASIDTKTKGQQEYNALLKAIPVVGAYLSEINKKTTGEDLLRQRSTTYGNGGIPSIVNQNFYIQKMTGDQIIAEANKALRKSGKGRLVFDN